MNSKVLFGPSGKPVNYSGPVYKATKYIKDEGLDSFEYVRFMVLESVKSQQTS